MGVAAHGPCCAWAAPWSIFIASPRHKIPKRITLDIDDTFDAVHGGQQLRLFNAHYDEYGFQPIVVFDGGGRFITAVLRPAKRPSCKEFAARNSRQGDQSLSASTVAGASRQLAQERNSAARR
jgi:hypothetical protein